MAALPLLPSKADQVYDLVRERILDGAYAPDSRLNMDAIAKELGVSKIPVREAIGRLESQRLVVSRPHAGPQVASLHAAELVGIYLARERIDALVAELAATRADGPALRHLDEIQAAMETALVERDVKQLADLNASFHLALASASGFEILGELTGQLLLAIRHHRSVEPLDVSNWTSVVTEHAALIASVRSGDAAAAAAAAAAHATSQSRQERTA